MKKEVLIWVGLFVLVSGALLVFQRVNQSSPEELSNRTSREVALDCTTDMATEYHIHPILKININGEQAVIPPDIGVRPGCMNALHTHDMVGTIHVESPEQRDFTLGDFFAVWEQPFSKEQVLTYGIDDSHRITVTVNGETITTYEDTVMKDGDVILISYEPIP